MTAATIVSVTLCGFGTVIDPKPIYTIGFSSAFALAIHSKREGGGVQLRSGLSKNQLESVVMRRRYIIFQVFTHYPETIVVSAQSRGFGTTA